jgi:hypothetical protein
VEAVLSITRGGEEVGGVTWLAHVRETFYQVHAGDIFRCRKLRWTKAEVHQLRMLAKRKVSADSIAKLVGRYVGSVRTKALELRLILSKKAKAKRK